MVPRATRPRPPPPPPPPPTTKDRTLSPISGHVNDADDERSSFSSASLLTMGPMTTDPPQDDPPPSYPGEDTRATSRKELLGFYTYSFAAEVFVVCGLGAFIPITLEELARGSPSAVRADDRSQPCRAHDIDNALVSRAGRNEGSQCVFNLLGTEMNTASFAMYTFSISVLVQALVVVSMSGAADHGRYRKTLLIAFAVIGALATMLYLPVTPSVYLLGSLWAIVGNVCFGASFVLLNSFLPLLVRNDSTIRGAKMHGYASVPAVVEDEDIVQDEPRTSDESPFPEAIDSTAALLPVEYLSTPYPPTPSASSPEMQLSTKLSSYGVGIGYSAAVLVQIISVVILKLTGASLFSLRLVLFVIGLWWLVFTIPAAFWLRPRPGPLIALGDSGQARSWLGYLAYSWRNLGRTMLRARRLKDVLLFLAAWFMISDAIATVSGTAVLFAKTTLGMEASALALINLFTTISGIIGAITWSAISRRIQLKPIQTIIACICLFELIPIYGLLGYIPAIQRFGSFGLQQQWEMYPLGVVYGFVLGGLSSYCRAVYGELIPPGNEAAFYALWAITDKGSSIFGPAIVGAITDATGDIRPAFFFLAVLIGLPIPIMFLIDVERGKREGARLAGETIKLAGSVADHEEMDGRALGESELRLHG